MNCKVKSNEVVKHEHMAPRQKKGRQRQQQQSQAAGAEAGEPSPATDQQEQQQQQTEVQPVVDRLNPVLCGVCDTEVGLRDIATGEYFFFQVVPSNS